VLLDVRGSGRPITVHCGDTCGRFLQRRGLEELVDRIRRSLLNDIPILHNARPIHPEDIHHSSVLLPIFVVLLVRSLEVYEPGTRPLVKALVIKLVRHGRPKWSECIDGVLPTALDQRSVHYIVLVYVCMECESDVSVYPETNTEFVENSCLFLRSGWTRRAVRLGCGLGKCGRDYGEKERDESDDVGKHGYSV
jgi:hypothetical protein